MHCTILARSLNECPDAVLDESSDGLKVWWCWSSSSSFPGLKGDELQNMLFWLSGNWEFLQVEREKELRKRLLRSEDPWLNGKSRPQGLAQKLRGPEEF